jgi:hypothetical protein
MVMHTPFPVIALLDRKDKCSIAKQKQVIRRFSRRMGYRVRRWYFLDGEMNVLRKINIDLAEDAFSAVLVYGRRQAQPRIDRQGVFLYLVDEAQIQWHSPVFYAQPQRNRHVRTL